MFGGVWLLGSLLAVSRERFVGLVKILRFLCISPEVNMSWLNIITFSGGHCMRARADAPKKK